MRWNNLTLSNIQASAYQVLGLCIALATIIGITILYSLWQWHKDWKLAHTELVNPPKVTEHKILQSSAQNMNHLFGKSPSKLGDMPITNLQLSVTGIVKVNTSHSKSISKAYISISGEPSKIYKVGDQLPYGVKVYEITHHAVILENNGQFERLPLLRKPLQFKAKPSEENK